VTLIGVGPGRDQVVWTEAGRETLVAGTPVASG
jgi:hypothetical protein